MKNLLVLAVATLFATNAFAAEMKWNGSAGWRYANLSQDDNLDSKNSAALGKDISTTKSRMHQVRANLGVMGGWEHVEYGIGIRTTNATNDDYTTVNTGADRNIGLEQAWFRYVRDFGSMDLGLTIGRQKNALAYDSQWETLFDNDVRWDGFGWNFKFGMFGFNASQYVIGAVTHTAPAVGATTGATGASNYSYTEASEANAGTTKHFAMLYGFQPHMNWKFSDDIEAMFSVAYYKWIYEGDNNQTGGGVSTAALNNGAAAAGTVPALAGNQYRMWNNSQWDFLATVTLPYNLNFTGDYVKSNKAAYNNTTMNGGWASTNNPEVGSSAWTLGLTYGKLRKAQDFTVGYAYGTKGIASVINTFTNDKFAADNKGHTVLLGYAMADNFHLGFRWISLQEKERLNAVAATTAAACGGAAYAGANANQKMKQNYWELTAGVAF